MIKVIPLRNGTLMFPIHLTRIGGGPRHRDDGNVIRFPSRANVVKLPARREGKQT